MDHPLGADALGRSFNRVRWARSSRCGSAACVEVAVSPGRVLVRDAKDPSAGTLCYGPDEWTAFLHQLKAGH